ncbi:DUF4345 family protein [Kordiimonas sp. SCSIO 12603]|uniref:DUF4345 family protein n=1 Tax=Kordiimonas sp. SCSIO 12603 TaxID=2829596 RepID=UPI00210572F0|nr:DUF4345 family protein [Kordiimonas sp. SCSIO 12603]UTW59950.1 DUF4345 family protein [Kordiimonas sp. SCSIO 12603]
MENLPEIFIGIATLMLFGLGMTSMFAPKKMLKNFAVEPVGIMGLNTIRGVIGGLFLGSVSMLVLGYMQEQTMWYLAVAILLGAVAIGRLVGLVFDGFDKAAIPPLIVELVMVGVLVYAI